MLGWVRFVDLWVFWIVFGKVTLSCVWLF